MTPATITIQLATLGYLARDYNRYGGLRVSYNF
jgi:hypothetical protein